MSFAMKSAPGRRLRRLILLPLLVVLLAVQVQTQGNRTRVDVARLGPQVGERVPDFTLLDQSGKSQSLQSIMGRRGAMLVFVRSADW